MLIQVLDCRWNPNKCTRMMLLVFSVRRGGDPGKNKDLWRELLFGKRARVVVCGFVPAVTHWGTHGCMKSRVQGRKKKKKARRVKSERLKMPLQDLHNDLERRETWLLAV